MNILILNWRDPYNPRSGGAEAITLKYAKHWSNNGHSVTWICNTFPGSKSVEFNDKLQFIRIGPALGFTVFQLLITYPLFLASAIITAIRLMRRNHFDLIIDEIHGLPFFVPLYSKSRTVLLVCEVAGAIWDKMYPWPISLIGKSLEQSIYWLYRNTETWAISQNTFQDVFAINHNPNIRILPLGIDTHVLPKTSKFNYPSAAFLGRLVKMKGVESAILAAYDISNKLPDFKLYIIGEASTGYRTFLEELVIKLKLSEKVIFCGRLNESEKFKLLSQVHFLIHPSYKEGFGLTVLEAGLMGTPTIARSGSSLDELVNHKQSGLIFKSDKEIPQLFIDWWSGEKYAGLCTSAKKNAQDRVWTRILPKSDSLLKIV